MLARQHLLTAREKVAERVERNDRAENQEAFDSLVILGRQKSLALPPA